MDMFIIAGPVSPWDQEYEEEIILRSGAGTLAPSPSGAWYRHTRGDMSKVQAWFDKGYRVRRVKVRLMDDVRAEEKRSERMSRIIKKAVSRGALRSHPRG